MEIMQMWDYLADREIANDDEIRLITCINGLNEETMRDILYVRTGYRSFEQITELENDEQ